MISVAIMGHGVVGSGVAEILYTHKQKLFAAIGEEIDVKHILDLREFPDSPYAERFTKDFKDIVNDIEVRVVVETMGGLHPAYEFVKECLSCGKSVVTSNKELVAAYGAELLAIASEQNANFLFEASVGGGIPIIRPINQCLVANNVSEIAGILNGTTNFILTKMIHEGMGFDEALKLAQELGYAERNPEADVEGHDACRKIAILSSLISEKTVRCEDIPCEGISRISTADFGYARAMKMAIKLLGVSRKSEDGSLSVRTAPFLVWEDHPLHGVQDVFNGVFVHGNMVDDLMFYGRGAGKFPTASAVVSDVMECAKNIGRNIGGGWSGEVMKLSDPAEDSYQYFVRIDDSEAAVAVYTFKATGKVNYNGAPAGETAFVTPEMTEKEFAQTAKSFKTIKQCIRLLQD